MFIEVVCPHSSYEVIGFLPICQMCNLRHGEGSNLHGQTVEQWGSLVQTLVGRRVPARPPGRRVWGIP